MTLLVEDSSKTFIGSGTVGPFTWTWRFFDNSHIIVTRVYDDGTREVLVDGNDYTLTGAMSYSGGSLTLNSALEVGQTLEVLRETEILQEVDLRNQGDFYPETYEEALDRIVSILQEKKLNLDRALQIALSDVGVVSTDVPSPEAGKFLQWNPAANALQNANKETIQVIDDGVIVDTLSALRATAPATENTIAYIAGYNSAGDGGHGFYRWDSSDLSAKIALYGGGGKYVAVDSDPTGATGAYVLLEDEANAEQLGSVGNGISDDTDAITGGMFPEFQEVSFLEGRDYLFNGYVINGKTYRAFVNTGVIDPSRTSVWDGLAREYIDSDGNIWMLEPRRYEGLINKLSNWDSLGLIRAIFSGTVNVTLVGTSITEGEDAQIEPINAWAVRLKYALQEAFPDVTWNWFNLGLNSRRLAWYIDSGYLALSSEPANKADGFWRPAPGVDDTATVDTWPAGSTEGESWLWHVEQTDPDLYILAFGMNSTVGDDEYADDLRTALAHARGLTKVPSVAFVTEMIPHQINDSAPEDVAAYGRVTRYIARNECAGLIDVARWWQFLRLGIDETEYVAMRESDISTWETVGALTNLTNNDIATTASAASGVIRRGNFCGISFSGTFEPNTISSSFFISAHIYGGGSYIDDSITIRRVSTQINIYDKSGHILQAFSAGAAVAAGVDETWDIRIVYNRIECWRDHSLVCSYSMENCGYLGGVGILLTDSDLTNITVDVLHPKRKGRPTLSDDMLVGRYSSTAWSNGDYSDGSNTINHPTRLALEYAQQNAIDGFISEVIMAADKGTSIQLVGTNDISINSTTAAATGDEVSFTLLKAAEVRVTVLFPFMNPSTNAADGVAYLFRDALSKQTRVMRINPVSAVDAKAEFIMFDLLEYLPAGSYTYLTKWKCTNAADTISSEPTGGNATHTRVMTVTIR